MNRPVHALALGLALAFGSLAAHATGIEQKGQPDTQLSTMPTYGMEVPARTALKSVVPAGWQLFIHQSAKLPDTLSWKLGDAWPKVLSDLSAAQDLAILIDWDEKRVLVRTNDVSVQEQATRAEISQAAVTPLPRFEEARSDKQAERLARKQPSPVATAPVVASASAPVVNRPAELSDTARMAQDELRRRQELERQAATQVEVTRALPVIRTNPTPAMVTAQEAAAVKNPPKLVSTAEFSYTQPVALNRPAARKVAQAIANKYNLRLVWAAPEVQLQGPVTLLAQSAQDDVRLLSKALGVFSSVFFEVSDNERVIRVLPRELAHVRAAAPVAVATSAVAPVQPAAPMDLTLTPQIAATPMTVAAAPVAVVPPAAAALPKITLTVGERQPLEDALVRFVRTYGYTLEWKVTGGFEANRAMTFEGETLVQVLSQLLPPLGISADVYTRDKHIVVRPGESRDR